MKIVVEGHPEVLGTRTWKDKMTNDEFLDINPKCIKYIEQTPERQMKVVRISIRCIEWIDDPTEEVQKYVLMKDPELVKYIENPSKKVLNLVKDL